MLECWESFKNKKMLIKGNCWNNKKRTQVFYIKLMIKEFAIIKKLNEKISLMHLLNQYIK